MIKVTIHRYDSDPSKITVETVEVDADVMETESSEVGAVLRLSKKYLTGTRAPKVVALFHNWDSAILEEDK